MLQIEINGEKCFCHMNTKEFTDKYPPKEAVRNVAIEIKAATLSAMSKAFVQLVDGTGEAPAFVGTELCNVTGIGVDNFFEFIELTMGSKE